MRLPSGGEVIGYAVIEAGNADAALQQIEAGEPVDLVFPTG